MRSIAALPFILALAVSLPFRPPALEQRHRGRSQKEGCIHRREAEPCLSAVTSTMPAASCSRRSCKRRCRVSRCDVHLNGWPTDEQFFDGADCIVMYCDGGAGHMVNKHLDEVDALAKKGVGIVCIHYGVEVPKGESGDKFLDWIGGYFETNWSVNPHWTAKFDNFPNHPISRGVQPFEINDEWYYHMRFRDGMQGVTPILVALPPPDRSAGRWHAQRQPGGAKGSARREKAAGDGLGGRADRRRPRLWLHRRARSLELGRSELSQAGAERDRLVRSWRRAGQWRRIADGDDEAARSEHGPQE